jgi:hypothetical protein
MNPSFWFLRSARSAAGTVVTSTPSSRYEPDCGRSRQPITFMNVDLPEPLGPMIATNSPVRTVSETPRRACTTLVPMTYDFVSSDTWMTGASPYGVVVGSETFKGSGVMKACPRA